VVIRDFSFRKGRDQQGEERGIHLQDVGNMGYLFWCAKNMTGVGGDKGNTTIQLAGRVSKEKR